MVKFIARNIIDSSRASRHVRWVISGLQHLLDSRFNQLIYLLAWESELVLNRKLSVSETLARNYFLHFCGGDHFLNLMNLLTEERIARNAPCPCGSEKRYKHCHGQYA